MNKKLALLAALLLASTVRAATTYPSPRLLSADPTLGAACGTGVVKDWPYVSKSSGSTFYCPLSTGNWAAEPSAGGSVTGSGSANRLSYWTGATSLGSDSGLTVDAVNDAMTVGGWFSLGPSAAGSTTDVLAVRRDQDSGTYTRVRNLNAGTLAHAGVQVYSDSAVGGIVAFSTTYAACPGCAGNVMVYTNTGKMLFGTAAGPRGGIDAAGLWGFGTTAPAYDFHFYKSANEAVTIGLQQATSGTAAYAEQFISTPSSSLYKESFTAGYTASTWGGNSLASWNRFRATGNGLIVTTVGASHPIIFGTNDAERMRLVDGGLAINKTTASTALDVSGTVTATDFACTGCINQATEITGITPVANGGTGLASGTSGGLLGYTATGTLASTAALSVGKIVIGGGAGAVPTASNCSAASSTLDCPANATDGGYLRLYQDSELGAKTWDLKLGQWNGAGNFTCTVDSSTGRIPDSCVGDGTDQTSGTVTSTASFTIDAPTAADNGKAQVQLPAASTITRISCSTDTGTATVNVNKRAEGTPNTTGTDALSADLVCDTNSQTSCAAGCDVATLSSAAVTARQLLALEVTSVASTPGVVRLHVEYTTP